MSYSVGWTRSGSLDTSDLLHWLHWTEQFPEPRAPAWWWLPDYPSGPLLGPSWAPLGPSWAPFGAFSLPETRLILTSFCRILKGQDKFALGPSWAPLGPLLSPILGPFWCILTYYLPLLRLLAEESDLLENIAATLGHMHRVQSRLGSALMDGYSARHCSDHPPIAYCLSHELQSRLDSLSVFRYQRTFFIGCIGLNNSQSHKHQPGGGLPDYLSSVY